MPLHALSPRGHPRSRLGNESESATFSVPRRRSSNSREVRISQEELEQIVHASAQGLGAEADASAQGLGVKADVSAQGVAQQMNEDGQGFGDASAQGFAEPGDAHSEGLGVETVVPSRLFGDASVQDFGMDTNAQGLGFQTDASDQGFREWVDGSAQGTRDQLEAQERRQSDEREGRQTEVEPVPRPTFGAEVDHCRTGSDESLKSNADGTAAFDGARTEPLLGGNRSGQGGSSAGESAASGEMHEGVRLDLGNGGDLTEDRDRPGETEEEPERHSVKAEVMNASVEGASNALRSRLLNKLRSMSVAQENDSPGGYESDWSTGASPPQALRAL
jgi:hypothetical protein